MNWGYLLWIYSPGLRELNKLPHVAKLTNPTAETRTCDFLALKSINIIHTNSPSVRLESEENRRRKPQCSLIWLKSHRIR